MLNEDRDAVAVLAVLPEEFFFVHLCDGPIAEFPVERELLANALEIMIGHLLVPNSYDWHKIRILP